MPDLGEHDIGRDCGGGRPQKRKNGVGERDKNHGDGLDLSLIHILELDGVEGPAAFDFSVLEQMPLSIKLDVGGSAYWSEIAQINTLDNLLTQGKISVIDYLERVPNGYISDQQQLIETLKEREAQAMSAACLLYTSRCV